MDVQLQRGPLTEVHSDVHVDLLVQARPSLQSAVTGITDSATN